MALEHSAYGLTAAMPTSTMAATIPPPPAADPDFTQRLDPALAPELMDEPCSYQDFRDCVRDIAATTRLTGAYQPTLQFLDNAVSRSSGQGTLRVLDVGSGGGDMLRQVSRWAQRRAYPLQLTGIDLNPHATRAALEFSSKDSQFDAIRWLTGDVFTDPAVQAPDVVLSSLVTHHMRDGEIVQFLRWMEQHARIGWFISDLIRSPRAFQLFGILSRVMRWHPFVRHDGLVSIRRAFREEDWLRLLQTADIPADAVRIHRSAIGRLCVTRLR